MASCDIVENVNPFQVEVDRYHHIRSSSTSGSRPDFFDYVNDEENSLIKEEVAVPKIASKVCSS